MRTRTLAIGAFALAAAGLAVGVSPAIASSRAATVTAVTFLSPSIGWVKLTPQGQRGGTLYRTTDGGARWSAVNVGLEATAFAFQNRAVGEALVFAGAGACQAQFTVVRTTDGGQTWHYPAAVRGEDGPIALTLASGRGLLLNGSCAGPYAKMQGAQAGHSAWQVRHEFSLSHGQALRYFSPTAVSLLFHGKSGFAALAYFPVKASSPPLLVGYASDNGGRTWSPVAIGNRGLGRPVYALSFTNARDGLAAVTQAKSSALTIYRTDDGGAHWYRSVTVRGATGAQLDLVTPRDGYAGVNTASGPRASYLLLKTTDGGRRWRATTRPS